MTTKTNAATITTDLADNAEPVINISDIHLMSGSLIGANDYPTYKGRVIAQIAKDSLFAGWMEYQAQQKDTAAPSDASAALRALEASTSPFKDGIDGTLEGTFDVNELGGLKARKELIFDCLKTTEDMDDETIAKIAKIVKDRATAEQVASIAKKNPEHRNVTRGIMVGLNNLEYSDESFDNLWLTKAVNFINQYPSRYPTDEDTANANLMQCVLAPRIKESTVAPIVTLDF